MKSRVILSVGLTFLFTIGCARPETVVSTRYKIPKGSSITVQMQKGDRYGVEQAVESVLEEVGLDVISDAVSSRVQRTSGQDKILTTGDVSIEKESVILHKSQYLCQVYIGNYYLNHPHVDNTTVKIIDLTTGKIILSMNASGGMFSSAEIKAELKEKLLAVISEK